MAQTEPLLDDVYKETLQQCRDRLQGSGAKTLEEQFENEDDVILEYDCELKEPQIMQSMIQLTTITTFLAGFVASDLGSFTEADWDGAHFAVPMVYIFLLAFSEGCCIYMSIVGVVAGAAYYRALNQLSGWNYQVTNALAPIGSNMKLLKGRRLSILQDAMAAVINNSADWVHCYPGPPRPPGMIPLDKPTTPATWKVSFQDPAHYLGNYWGFRVVQDPAFPMAVVSYIVAQAMYLCIRSSFRVSLVGSSVISIWALKLGSNLIALYSKLRD